MHNQQLHIVYIIIIIIIIIRYYEGWSNQRRWDGRDT